MKRIYKAKEAGELINKALLVTKTYFDEYGRQKEIDVKLIRLLEEYKSDNAGFPMEQLSWRDYLFEEEQYFIAPTLGVACLSNAKLIFLLPRGKGFEGVVYRDYSTADIAWGDHFRLGHLLSECDKNDQYVILNEEENDLIYKYI